MAVYPAAWLHGCCACVYDIVMTLCMLTRVPSCTCSPRYRQPGQLTWFECYQKMMSQTNKPEQLKGIFEHVSVGGHCMVEM